MNWFLRLLGMHVHAWTKWEDYCPVKETYANGLSGTVGVEQRRRCSDCGALGIRKVTL